MSELRKINIDGTEYEVPGNYTLMQACEAVSYTHLTLPTKA